MESRIVKIFLDSLKTYFEWRAITAVYDSSVCNFLVPVPIKISFLCPNDTNIAATIHSDAETAYPCHGLIGD